MPEANDRPPNDPDADKQHPGAVAVLRDLVEISSLSGREGQACQWLVGRMLELGYARAYVDGAGNAVGEMGDAGAATVLMLLGHIDTVPGDIPVRIERTDEGEVLFGRGSVDAKGPLATFVMAGSRLGDGWARKRGVRLVVVGAVEEEAATSKGARHIRDRFDGESEPVPAACIIGEPSGWNRVTLGYKGRLLVELDCGQPMAHTAGPDSGIATRVVQFWNWLEAYAAEVNIGRERVFDQLQPSLREVQTTIDDEMNDRVWARAGIRLPLDFDAKTFAEQLLRYCADQLGVVAVDSVTVEEGLDQELRLCGDAGWMSIVLRGYEQAWRSTRDTALVRAFLGAIRDHDARPGFVVKTGTSDMNVVAPAWQCPIVAYGPGDSALDHTPSEHVSLAEYGSSIDVLVTALQTLAQTVEQPA